ncbi:MAG: SH3 domain-containing protein [Anaerolineae bacterium]|nr:SH3 domain-containing protein [Anaerolineae bacterium]
MKRRDWLALLIILHALAATVPATAAACPHAPAPRLRPGSIAIVAPGVDRLNVRALPAVDTGVRAQLYQLAAMTVLDGPSCNGGYNWWRVELADGTRGWVAEGTWARYYAIPASARPVDPFVWSCAPRLRRWCILP